MISTRFDEGILKEFQDSGKKGEGQYIGHMYTYKQISIYIFCFNYYCFIYFLIIIEYTGLYCILYRLVSQMPKSA